MILENYLPLLFSGVANNASVAIKKVKISDIFETAVYLFIEYAFLFGYFALIMAKCCFRPQFFCLKRGKFYARQIKTNRSIT